MYEALSVSVRVSIYKICGVTQEHDVATVSGNRWAGAGPVSLEPGRGDANALGCLSVDRDRADADHDEGGERTGEGTEQHEQPAFRATNWESPGCGAAILPDGPTS